MRGDADVVDLGATLSYGSLAARKDDTSQPIHAIQERQPILAKPEYRLDPVPCPHALTVTGLTGKFPWIALNSSTYSSLSRAWVRSPGTVAMYFWRRDSSVPPSVTIARLQYPLAACSAWSEGTSPVRSVWTMYRSQSCCYGRNKQIRLSPHFHLLLHEKGCINSCSILSPIFWVRKQSVDATLVQRQ